MVTAPASVMDTPRSRRLNRKPARISLHKAMNLFFDRDDSELKFGTRTDYENTLMILEHYVDSFGTVLLRASDSIPPLPKPKSGTVSKRYDPASLEQFFRGFVLFFLQYKLNAPAEIKETFTKIVEEFVEWLKAKGHLPAGTRCNFELSDAKCMYRAMHAVNVLEKAIAHSARSRKNLEDIRDCEPLYMVSRVKSGKLWFIYYAGDKCDEFGPVNVPLGVSDLIEQGWLIDCEFGKYKGKWQFKSLRGIMPV